ncbi:MAG: class I SAM-dependent methyltransferase [Gaiellaceae bacterium]
MPAEPESPVGRWRARWSSVTQRTSRRPERSAPRPGLRKRLSRRLRLPSPTRRIRFELATAALERRAQNGPLRLLDAGCSEALLTEKMGRRHPDWSIDAVDTDEQVLGLAAASLRSAGVDNVRLLERDLTEALGEEIYDAVLALECLALIPDDQAALSSMAAALKPGGVLIAHVPSKSWRPVSARGRTIWPGEARHGYTLEELTVKLERAGLALVAWTPSSRSLARLGSELADRVEHTSAPIRLAWYPLSVAIAWLDRHGLSWGAATGLFVEARR